MIYQNYRTFHLSSKNTHTNRRFVFDLFAGCGGLSTGLETAGFSPALVCELDKDALGSYLLNRHSILGGQEFRDIKNLHFNNIDELTTDVVKSVKSYLEEIDCGLVFSGKNGSNLDLICGGPPCQGYSGIGHRRSYGVEKKDLPSNQLYAKMAAFIENIRPKIFLFENVKGILSGRWTSEGRKGEIWEDVRSRFRQIEGYQVRWALVHAKHYGVPQNRPRVLLVGIREDVILQAGLDIEADVECAIKCGFLPQPSGVAPHPIELLSDLIDPSVAKSLLTQTFPDDFATRKYPEEPLTDIQKALRTLPSGEILGQGAEITEHEYSKHSPHIVNKFKYMLENDGEIPETLKTKKFAQRVIPKYWGDNGPSITATSLADDYVHFSQPRSFTVREWARLQMFPDWYQFAGKRTTGGIRRAGNPRAGIFDRETPKYTQIGNAVPVGLASKVGAHLQGILNLAES